MNELRHRIGTRHLRLSRKDRVDESGVRKRPTQLAPEAIPADWRARLNTFVGNDQSTQIGPYHLFERIGSGSMGHVYRAQHTLLGHTVAIKVLRPELAGDEDCARRFVAEARAVNEIHHENVIDVTDFARETSGVPWFAMELLEGADLFTAQAEAPIGLRRSLEVARQLCEALHAVHAAGIIHCDVKPENTFICRRGGKDVVKLIDFGIARLAAAASSEPSVSAGGINGTPPYIAPEQVTDGRIDHRADLYAVGALLFDLVTGRPPFQRRDVRALLNDVTFAAPPLPSSLASVPVALRRDLDALILRCLAKSPSERPQSARAIAAIVAELSTRLDSAASPFTRPARLASVGRPGLALFAAAAP